MKTKKHESPAGKKDRKAGGPGSTEDTSEADQAQGRRARKDEPDVDPKTAELEAAPESERWEPLPVSSGHKVPVAPRDDEDEDDEGRSQPEQLVEDGVEKAERDETIEASREETRRNR